MTVMTATGETTPATVRQARTGPMPTGGRWGWYRDHLGNEYRRVSNMIKKVETDTYNLDLWYKRQVAEGLAIRDDLVLSIKAMGRPDPLEGWSREDKKKLDGIVKEAEGAAKQRNGARSGTAYHDLTERVDRGEAIDDVVRGLPAAAAQTLRAYAFLRRENYWRSVEIERTVVCDELECAGTFDRVDEVPQLTELLGPWTCQHGHDHGDQPSQVVVDVKTEKAPWLNGLHIGPQLGIYSRSRKMWRPTGGTVKVRFSKTGDEVDMPAGEYVPAPCVRQDVAIVVHVYDGQAVPYFLNLVEGWDAARAAYEQMNREARAKRELGADGAWFAAVPGVKLPERLDMFTEQAVAADYANPNRWRPPAAEDLASAMPVMVGDHVANEVGDTLTRDGAVTHEAVRGPDGLVRWQAVPAEPPVAEAPAGVLDEVDKSAVEAVWAAETLDDLGKVWTIYTDTCGRTWGGRVAEAAEARRRQIECPQRALHAGSGKCACGWTTGVPA